jgi:hypothetical protein
VSIFEETGGELGAVGHDRSLELFFDRFEVIARFVRRTVTRLAAGVRRFSLTVTNVPGPPVPLCLAGAPLLELFPLVPIVGNQTLNVAVFSYTGQLNLTAVADNDTCPDVSVFAHGVRTTLHKLARLAVMTAPEQASALPEKS